MRTPTAPDRWGWLPAGPTSCPVCSPPRSCRQTRDAHGRPFAVLCHPHVRHLTVVLESEPDGASLADQRQVDQWVAHHGEWLAALSREPGLIACQISIESSPDPGTRLRHMLANRRSDSAPSYAEEVMDEIRDTYPAGAAELKARIALTYRMNAAGGRKLSAAEKAHEVGRAASRAVRHPAQHGGGRSGPRRRPAAVRDRQGGLRPRRGRDDRELPRGRRDRGVAMGRRGARERAGAAALLPPRRGDLGHLGDGRRAAHRRRGDRPWGVARPAPRHSPQARHVALPRPVPGRGGADGRERRPRRRVSRKHPEQPLGPGQARGAVRSRDRGRGSPRRGPDQRGDARDRLGARGGRARRGASPRSRTSARRRGSTCGWSRTRRTPRSPPRCRWACGCPSTSRCRG